MYVNLEPFLALLIYYELLPLRHALYLNGYLTVKNADSDLH